MQYDLYIEHVAGTVNNVADCLSRIADELPKSEVKHLQEAEDIINFPISLYYAEHQHQQASCYMNAGNQKENSVKIGNKPKTGENSPKRIPLKELLFTDLPESES